MDPKNYLKPDFIGIGAMKSASGWIYECLKQHPEICSLTKKEIHFFDKLSNYKKGLEYYYSFFEQCPKEKIKGEYTPAYIYKKHVPGLIYKALPKVKIIACLRDPIDRAYSNYRYSVHLNGRLSIYKDFEEAINNDLELLERGFYYQQLKRYYKLFPEENILVLIFKDIIEDPVNFIHRIYKFLELKNQKFRPPILNEKKHVTGKKSANTTIPYVNKLLYKIYGYFNKNPIFKKMIKEMHLDEYGLDFIRFNRNIIRKNKIDNHPVAPLKKETERYLYSIYEEDIENLEELLNKSLDAWKRL